mmetsp:Transcript_147/g.370  ORF Transcript_147/g.370 Transcript_147/m.370 type:complete len:261 (+) Transcript_147:2076-2858(+)
MGVPSTEGYPPYISSMLALKICIVSPSFSGAPCFPGCVNGSFQKYFHQNGRPSWSAFPYTLNSLVSADRLPPVSLEMTKVLNSASLMNTFGGVADSDGVVLGTTALFRGFMDLSFGLFRPRAWGIPLSILTSSLGEGGPAHRGPKEAWRPARCEEGARAVEGRDRDRDRDRDGVSADGRARSRSAREATRATETARNRAWWALQPGRWRRPCGRVSCCSILAVSCVYVCVGGVRAQTVAEKGQGLSPVSLASQQPLLANS